MGNRLGINLGFAINKYIEPEVWTRIVREELGLGYVQFVADLLNPFWPEEYIEDQIRRIRTSADAYDIKIESIFSSAFTRVNHMMNPDAEARKFWLAWFKRLLEIGAKLGAKNGGSHFGIMTFDTYEDPEKRAKITEEGIRGWQALTRHAKELGYEELIFEPMSIPREMAHTIAETKDLMNRVNEDGGVPLKLCLDVGHAPHPDERDPYKWLEALAADSPIIHLQQTVRDKSHHWPFTSEFNEIGIIKREKVLEVAGKAGNTDALYIFEISHREHYDTDFRIISDLRESVQYWRVVIKD